MTNIFPITERERGVLEALGYQSGFCWDREYDYWYGKTWQVAKWDGLTEDQVSELKTDLLNVRRWLAEADHRERCEAAALLMYEALAELEYVEVDGYRVCLRCGLLEGMGHTPGCIVGQALAAAEGVE